jgi:hypothetical protein
MKKLLMTAAILFATACTPEQIQAFRTIAEPYDGGLSEQQLYKLRMCESTDNYQATDKPVGKHRGAYQFSQTTWDSVASRHFPWLVGVDPIDAEPWWQDLMAKALWSERGRAPWPVCGKRI